MAGLVTPSLYSALWYRVAPLKPRLSASVVSERQVSRGVTWHLLSLADGGQPVRLNDAAYAFAGRLTGERTVEALWNLLLEDDEEAAPTQDEAITILWRLHERRLLQTQPGIDFEAVFGEWAAANRQAGRRRLNPLAMRFGLGNPRRILEPLEPLAHRLIGWPALCVWALVVGYGLLQAAANWDALAAHAAKWLATPYYLLLALAVYPAIKALHELAHGLALRRWGCEVREAGVTLLMLMPLPFVDASSAATLPRWPRVIVSGAGILVELFIAAVALAIWLNVEPGIVRDLAFVAAFTASVSTVLANGNPLLRFDGYYVLVDALDLPNLASRSARYWVALLRRYLLRVAPGDEPASARGERAWLIAYAPLSWIYRVTICVVIAAWVGRMSFVLGALVGLTFAAVLLMPAARALKGLLTGPSLDTRERTRALAVTAAALFLAACVLALVPMPYGAVSQGVVWLPDDARVRAESDGYVAQVVAQHGARISKGDVVLVLRNPRLTAEREQLAARVAALEPELFLASRSDPGKAANAAEQLDQLRAELARSEEREAGLTVRAGADGTLDLPRQHDLQGSYLSKGAMLGHVFTQAPTVIRVAVDEDEAALIGARTRATQARLSSEPRLERRAELVRDARGTSAELPSAALSTRYGGRLLTDPDDKKGLKPLAPVVLVDVRLADTVQDRFGERAWVRFDYGAAPLAEQWLRRLRQALLGQFNPAT